MFCELVTLVPKPGRLNAALSRVETAAGADLLGCWTTVLGNTPRILVLRRAGALADHDQRRSAVVGNTGIMSVADDMQSITIDRYATLPCLPDVIAPGAYGAIYEFRIYQLQPMGAIQAAITGWGTVIQVRLDIAPIACVMHSTGGQVPRLVHVYPYRDLAHREAVRHQAIATGLWPPKGGASRNQVMATEIAVPASFSPLH